MSQFFIRRPIVAMVISLLFVLGGLIAIDRLPIAQYPDIVPPQVLVSTTFTGADAVAIEQSVASPIEQQINGVENSLYIQSTNASDGTYQLRVTFDVGTNIDIDNVLTQNRVAKAQPFLPADVKQYGVAIDKAFPLPLLVVALYSPDDRFDADFLSNYLVINVNDDLARVRGVGKVTSFGAANYAMRVWLDPNRLTGFGLTVADVRNALQAQNTVNPAGQVGAEPAPAGQEFTYSVRAQGRLVLPDEFGAVILRANPDGSFVRLRDVARISLGTENYMQESRFNGRPSAALGIYQSPGTNALELADNIQAKLEELSQKFPEGLKYDVALDTTAAVRVGIEEILKTLLEAIALVILVVFLFLQSVRATLIPIAAVPVSLIGTFALFPVLGFSINTVSLFGLVLSIGILVDDAIVVVEAVEHHIEQGMTAMAATQLAMKEISGALIGIALVLSSVFLPVALLGGITGRLFQQFALTIAVSVLISAINALSLSPALASRILRPRKKSRGPLQRMFGGFNRGFAKTTDGYVRAASLFVRKAVLIVVLLGGMAALAFAGSRFVPSGFVPEEDQGYLFANVELPAAASLQRTKQVAIEVTELIRKDPDIQSVVSIAGFSLLSSTSSSYSVTCFIKLKPWDARSGAANSAQGVMAKLNMVLSQVPQARAMVFSPPAIPGIGRGGGFSFMLEDMAGGTPQELAQQAQAFIAAAQKRPELIGVNTLYRADVPQLFVKVDRERVLTQGVPIGDVYQTLQAFMGSSYVNDFNRFGRVWKVYMAAEPAFRNNADNMRSFYVRNGENEMVPLGAFVNVTTQTGPDYTTRFNLHRAAEILGSAAPGYSSDDAQKALAEVAAEVLPADYDFSWNAMSYQEATAPGSAGIFVLCIVFVFLVLAALYESWSLPIIILLAVPGAIAGGFLGLFLGRESFDIYGQIGLIVLVGLVAKNAILIVEFAKQETDRGVPVQKAALDAARLRLRPILMTAFAFILGAVPLVLAEGAGAVSRRTMGYVVVVGMLVATLVGVLVTPALYVVIQGLRDKYFQRRRPNGKPALPPTREPPSHGAN